VKSRVTVDGVIAVVDGAALADGMVASDMDALAAQRAADDQLDHDDPIEEVFEDQIACADLVILSKSDLIDAAGRERAERTIAAHLPRAVKVVAVKDGHVDPAILLGLGLAVEDQIDARKTHHDGLEDHDHDDFDTFIVEIGAIADPSEIAARVAAVAEKENVLRVKGFVPVDGKPMRLLVQAVGARVNHYFDRAWAPAEERLGRLVVIGEKGLRQDAITAALTG
ncbi:MAG: GTP-binding protein, partial [Dehalococcoidia bacterium]